MIKTAIDRLQYLCNTIPDLLMAIDENDFSLKPAPGKWSKKEIIGHLIDSATNNHQRFVRGQFEEDAVIYYDQDKWNEFSFHQQLTAKNLIEFWTSYNRHLAELIKHIPEKNLFNSCVMKDGSKRTLDFLINDYVIHMEHHLHQVVNY